MKDKVAIVVSSCDFFEDCWAPFFHSMKKYWPDCEWPVYMVSNHKEMACPEGFHFAKVGDDKKFASNLKRSLEQIDAEYVVYLQEDYFLNQKVDNDAIKRHVDYCQTNGVDYLRLGFPYLKGKQVDEVYTENDWLAPYALCLQAAIWKKETLYALLLENWSGWDFEYKIQKWAQEQGLKLRVFGLREGQKAIGVNYVTGTAVRKGRWTRPGYQYLKDEGFTDLLDKRGLEGWVFYHLQEVHGIFRKPCLAVVKLMKIVNWNF